LIEPVAAEHPSRLDAVQFLQLVEHEIFERIIFHFLLRRFGSATEITFFKRFERLERLERFEPVGIYPNASATTPRTIAPAAAKRRCTSPSASKRVPIAVPMRMLISRAGAT
jgi:hypothetical protein